MRRCWRHHILFGLTCYVLLLQRTSCFRIPKDDVRPKSKCHNNVTYSSNDHTAGPLPKCIALNHPYCLDIRLPYNSTILPDYLPDLNLKSSEEISSYLERWRGVKKLPKCWPVLQMALCSALMPQCEEDLSTGRVSRFYRPNVDICYDLVIKDECRFLSRQFEDWPALFNCNDTNIYARNCTNELRVLKFSGSTGQTQCQYPLVPNNDDSTWFRDIGGCAIHCKFPVFSIHEQANIATFIKVLCAMGLLSTTAAIILFGANKATSKSSRMAKIIKRCTWCQLLVYIGWSLQTILNNDIACSPSGSILYGLPLVANSCVLSFLLTYLPSMSSLFWCAHLGKLCHEKLIGKEDKSPGHVEIDRALSLFNYGIPLTLFVCVAFLGHIDGRGLHGICTVGQQSIIIKSVFVFAPTILGTLYGNYYFMQIIFKLWFEKGTAMKPSLWRIFIRITALSVLTLLQIVFESANYFYEHLNEARWMESIDRFVGCQLSLNNLDLAIPLQDTYTVNERHGCAIGSKPLIILDYLEIFTKLTIGIVIASWAFYESNYRGLRRKLIDLLEDDKERQRRAKSFINQEPSLLHGRTNGEFPKFRRDDPEQATYRDLIDMTSPTRCCNDQQAGEELEDDDDDDDDRAQDNRREISNQRRLSTETPSSLGSTALPSGLNSDNSSILHNSVGFGIRSKVSRSHKGMTSRDVVNDCKQRKQQQHAIVFPQAAPDPTPYLDAHRWLLDQMRNRFNPPNLGMLQTDPVRQPQFHHGICTYAPAQDESQNSSVQQEESKT